MATNSSNNGDGNGTLTFEPIDSTTTKAIVTREGKVYEIRLRHATKEGIQQLKQLQEEMLKAKESAIQEKTSD